MNKLQLFQSITSIRLTESQFNSLYERAIQQLEVIVPATTLLYTLGVVLDSEGFSEEARVFFNQSGLFGIERVNNAYARAKALNQQGENKRAEALFIECLHDIADLRDRDKHISKQPEIERYRAFPKYSYFTLDALHHMREGAAMDTRLESLEMRIFHFLGQICEFDKRYDEAIAYYDQCMSISTQIGYWDASQRHREVRKSLLRALRIQRSEQDFDITLISMNPTDSEAGSTYSGALLVLGTHLANQGRHLKLLMNPREEDVLAYAGRSKFIGFSVMTSQIGESLRLSRKVKKLFPEVRIVWGGVHPTLYGEQVLQEPCIDFIIRGAGEEALNQLIESHSSIEKLEAIPCLGYKEDGRIRMNEEKPFDFSTIGRYRFDLMEVADWLDHRIGAIPLPYPAFVYYASKGCPMGCTFCINSVTKNFSRRQPKRLEDIMDDLEHLIRTVNIRCIFFYDEFFFGTPKWFTQFLDALEARQIHLAWGANFHIQSILHNPDLIRRAQKLGLQFVSCSAESGNDRILKLLNKHITVKNTLDCFEFLSDLGLITLSSFISHLPTETPAEIQETFQLRNQLKEMFDRKGVLSYLNGPQPLRPYPGTTLYRNYIQSGYDEPKTLDQWAEFVSPSGNMMVEEDFFWLPQNQ